MYWDRHKHRDGGIFDVEKKVRVRREGVKSRCYLILLKYANGGLSCLHTGIQDNCRIISLPSGQWGSNLCCLSLTERYIFGKKRKFVDYSLCLSSQPEIFNHCRNCETHFELGWAPTNSWHTLSEWVFQKFGKGNMEISKMENLQSFLNTFTIWKKCFKPTNHIIEFGLQALTIFPDKSHTRRFNRKFLIFKPEAKPWSFSVGTW